MKREEIDNLKFGDKITCSFAFNATAVFLHSDMDVLTFRFNGDHVDTTFTTKYLLLDCFQLHKKEKKFKHLQRFMCKGGLLSIVKSNVCTTTLSDACTDFWNVPVIISYRNEDLE